MCTVFPPGTALRIDLIRHGESVNNARPVSVPDAPLTARGHRQAAALATAWRGEHLDVIVSSPLWRALETAEGLRQSTGAPVRVWPQLVEWNRSYPSDGRSVAEVAHRFPWSDFDPPLESVSWPAYPGEETADAVRLRAEHVVRRVAETYGARDRDPAARVDRMVLVGHQGFASVLLQAWLRAGAARFRQGNCHVHTLELAPGRITLVRSNAPGSNEGDTDSAPGAQGSGGAGATPDHGVGAGTSRQPTATMREVAFVRHGQSVANVSGERLVDPPLTPLGHRQAERTARALAGSGLSAVVCSPMVRALETACVIAAAARLPVHVWPALVEFNTWDAYTTLPAAALTARFPTALLHADFPAGGASFPAQETEAQGRQRVRGLLRRLEDTFPSGARIAVVAHGTLLGMTLAEVCGVPPATPVAFGQHNAGIHRIRWEGTRPDVLSVNDDSHLHGLE